MSERDVSGLSFEDLRERVIDEGIEAARRDYTRADQKEKLEGSVAGFEGCRGLDQNELADLLTTARDGQTLGSAPELLWLNPAASFQRADASLFDTLEPR